MKDPKLPEYAVDFFSSRHTWADTIKFYCRVKAEERERILKFADDIVISAIGQVIEGDADLAVIYAGFRTKLKTKLTEVPTDE